MPAPAEDNYYHDSNPTLPSRGPETWPKVADLYPPVRPKAPVPIHTLPYHLALPQQPSRPPPPLPTASSPFLDLPPELHIHIFNYLEPYVPSGYVKYIGLKEPKYLEPHPTRVIHPAYILLRVLFSRRRQGRKHSLYLLYASLLFRPVKKVILECLNLKKRDSTALVALRDIMRSEEIAAWNVRDFVRSFWLTRVHDDVYSLRLWGAFFDIWDEPDDLTGKEWRDEKYWEPEGKEPAEWAGTGVRMTVKDQLENLLGPTAMDRQMRGLVALLLSRVVKREGLLWTRDENVLNAQLTALCCPQYQRLRDETGEAMGKEEKLNELRLKEPVKMVWLQLKAGNVIVEKNGRIRQIFPWMVIQAIQMGLMDELGWWRCTAPMLDIDLAVEPVEGLGEEEGSAVWVRFKNANAWGG
ncbi:hypothetical protein BJ508DRAFT_411296 [Ascobolus immersus RN42]|uniref:Uncharacterized protein n=1 Tax=Ascobolus immersus RN42 TaxID=1160509 RepID=A0A3N4ILA1_ASCIM|nr:hypothetical protein BJ508DRAFT_411296 [Ascobolus immersus RN42]